MNSIYILDSSSLITPFRNYYAMDIAPSFWKNVEHYANEGIICTIDKVKNEIDKIDDDLKNWFNLNFTNNNFPVPFNKRENKENLFAFGSVDREWESYQEVILWAESQDYTKAALEEFKSSEIADAFLIAFCKANNLTLVTEEKSRNSKKRVSILDVCAGFGVNCINIFEMMRRLGITL